MHRIICIYEHYFRDEKAPILRDFEESYKLKFLHADQPIRYSTILEVFFCGCHFKTCNRYTAVHLFRLSILKQILWKIMFWPSSAPHKYFSSKRWGYFIGTTVVKVCHYRPHLLYYWYTATVHRSQQPHHRARCN